jgi:hypothetical protein
VKLSAHLSRTDRLIATWLAVTGAENGKPVTPGQALVVIKQ